ncbi:MAG: 1,4-alpha-glucan branching protein GlgB [Vicinamibacterales bacterium]|nr:1,4-alpha-glucan branching protein GlgB [Vicinamibacterales bacterium]
MVVSEPGLTAAVLTDHDLRRLHEGRHVRAYEKLGAHLACVDGVHGVQFAVVAPHAERVSVVGDFNGWETEAHPMDAIRDSGVWQVFVPGAQPGSLYKYRIRPHHGYADIDKADPFAFAAEVPPRTASRVCDLSAFAWGDDRWLTNRADRQKQSSPISIYEAHLGSWRRAPGDGRWLSYRELADTLTDYLVEMGFTHLEMLPVVEHPMDASWGYQATGYFAPTSRFGTPEDFRHLVDTLHQAGIGVILDWVPGHFPDDPHGLATFDGTPLYEHADPRQGRHPEWHTHLFDLGRPEVHNFLLSNARFWLDHYHIDGLRVDAVASMLYLDYARAPGEWVPNADGGSENPDAVDFLWTLNETIHRDFPDVMTIAEESTAWPGVSRPIETGGLGFSFKWNMGWMHDTLSFVARDPGRRSCHMDELTFSLVYAFSEHFVLPLSHDEVVHEKRAIVGKMPGDDWHQLANTRLLYGYLYGHPGKKLLFMGNEIGQRKEWDHDGSVDWSLTTAPLHAGLQRWVRDLNEIYRSDARLHALDSEPDGFDWVEHTDRSAGIISFLRRDRSHRWPLLFVCNFGAVVCHRHRIGVPVGGWWAERLNSDATCYGGSGQGNLGGVEADTVPRHGYPHSLEVTVPPLATLVLDSAGESAMHARGVGEGPSLYCAT